MRADAPVRVGVVGAGYWGPNLIRNLYDMRSAELVAVADLSQDRLDWVASRYPKVTTTLRVDDFFDMGIEAVVIATPPATHFKLGQKFLERGVHCMIEKPLATNVADAQKLVQLAKSVGVQLMTGHTFLYSTAVHEMRAMADRGDLGEVYYIDCVRTNLGLFQTHTDAMWDLAPHDLSIINYILGEQPVRVSALGGSFVMRSAGVNDLVYLHLEYPGGKLASIRVSWLDPHKTRMTTVVGDRKMVVYNDVEPAEKLRIYDRGAEAAPIPETFGEFQFSYRHGDVRIPHLRIEEPLRVECEAFVEAITEQIPPLSDGVFGVEVVEVLAAAERSLRVGAPVAVNEDVGLMTGVPSASIAAAESN